MNIRKFAALALAAMVAFLTSSANAAVEIVTSTNGDVSFVPGALATPLLAAAVAAVGAGAVLVLLSIGIRWVYRAFKRG